MFVLCDICDAFQSFSAQESLQEREWCVCFPLSQGNDKLVLVAFFLIPKEFFFPFDAPQHKI